MTGSEKSQLEKVRHELNENIESLHREIEKLQSANSDLQRQRDNLEDEKEDISKDKQRQIKENERWSVGSSFLKGKTLFNDLLLLKEFRFCFQSVKLFSKLKLFVLGCR